ncbi:2-dehydropantoate 2-reductase [Neobacillus kokaensis]|uniref:2-dehydropantoate 2-reductase n=1 Tax=Neobacillus kokaensis TaxID=2759023 RepID=A0ABQ3NBG3_9BACI|nr:2-dehydropantoate 2-reductase [Neobacillus kokaensis]GHI01259.1 2-dehydropantoate 2-reductase [Neobacillus kokaensis]
MKVGIVGSGSIGLLFAAYLSRAFDVNVYTKTEEQAVEINKYGILLKKGSGRTITFVTALPFSKWEGAEDISIIAVKQYQLVDIIEKINQLPSDPKNLLFLQNGMGHLKQLESIRARNIFVGSIEHGALRENPYTVSHNGMGMTNVAVFKGECEPLIQFVSSVPVEFPFAVRDQYHDMLVKKLMVNAVINPLTAILNVENGALVYNSNYYRVLEKLFEEVAEILELENTQAHLEQLINICHTTADNRSSMLKDLEAQRLTEIDAILGFILAEAVKKGKKTPLIESFYYLIKGKETGGKEVKI